MEVKCILKACVGSQSGTSQRTGNPVDRCKQWEDFFNGMPNKEAPVLIKYEIDAREYDGRWFNTIEAWNIEITTW